MNLHHHWGFAQDWNENGRLVHGELNEQAGMVTVTDSDTGEFLRCFTCESKASFVCHVIAWGIVERS